MNPDLELAAFPVAFIVVGANGYRGARCSAPTGVEFACLAVLAGVGVAHVGTVILFIRPTLLVDLALLLAIVGIVRLLLWIVGAGDEAFLYCRTSVLETCAWVSHSQPLAGSGSLAALYVPLE